MSHRALVAIQRGEDSYDHFYSHNGAFQLQLRDQLEENAEQLCQSTDPNSLGGFSTRNVPMMNKWEPTGGHDNLSYRSMMGDGIDSEPTATGIPEKFVGAPIDFDNIEAFYIVEESGVSTYVPVWIWPNVIRCLRDALEIEIYRGGRLDSDPAKMVERLNDDEPLAVVNSETIGPGADWLSNTVICEVLREHHAGIIALWKMQLDEGVPQKVAKDADDGERPDPTGLLHLENYIVRFSVLDVDRTPPPGTGLGVLVELPPNATESDREHVWYEGSKTRFNIGAGMNVMRSEPDDEDIVGGMSDVFTELYEKFGSRLSPRSPPPGGMLVETMHNLSEQQAAADVDLETDIEPDNLLSRVGSDVFDSRQN